MGLFLILKRLFGTKTTEIKPNTTELLIPKPAKPPVQKLKPLQPAVIGKKVITKNNKRIYRK